MIRIRLQRKGRKKRPIYHLVVADSRSSRDGRIIEQVGRYDNVTEKKEVVLNEDRIMYWLETGAQPSDTVRKILRNEGILYKRHLMMWGKSEEEIEAALTEWRAYRDSKLEDSTSRKDKYKSILDAEEKEFKQQVEKKASEAAKELATEDEAETEAEATEEAPAETASEEVAEEATEETTEEAPAEEEVEVAEEPAAEEETTEEVAAEAETTEEETTEEPAEEEKAEEKSEEAASTSGTSEDMTAKEAIDHIRDNDMAALEGFVTDAESRKTVLAAWEAKQSEG